MTGNLAKVVFHAGPIHNPSRVGLKCTFRSVPCGGILNTANGSFQTPNWPATYPVNVNCEWRIRLPDARKVVELTCGHQPFGIAGNLPGCDKDYLKLYDGHSKQDTSHGPYCHFIPPDVVKMSSNLAMAVFHAGPSHNPSRLGFKCTFESVEAPRVLNTANGSFQTPNWPATYPVNIDREWRIELPDARKLVELKCDHQPFGIAGGLPDCSLDYLKLYDGHDSIRDTSYGPFCHFTPPEVLKMSSNLAMAVFHAGPSHSSTRRGFRCTFESVEAPTTLPPCGGVLNTASGSFQTPNWPETYPNNIDCQWTIELPDASNLVELKCDHQPFGIAGDLPDCSLDYLKLYDGHDSTRDTSYGPFCHFTPPEVLKMSSNLAMAVFHAGPSHSPSRRGFRCTFESVEAPTIPPPCGGVLNTASGSFQTPNWPETYPNNIDCQWTIELPDASNLVELKCDHQPFGIAGGLPDCSLDYLKLYDGHDSTRDTSYGPFCYFTPPEVLKMSSNLAMAVFHAGPSHSPSRRGFRCTFESVEAPTTLPPTPPTTIPPPCGGVLNTASGSFQTPNWPETYPSNVDCQWTIALPDASNLVELKCDHQPFGIAGGLPDCDQDYLKVYDGHSTQNTSYYGPFCHFTPPDTLKMSSNKAMAVFHAGPSHSTSRKGFRCTFRSLPSSPPPPSTSECGGVLTTPSGSFQTQNWPSTYPVNIDCQWTIRLPNTNRRVELIFENQFGIAGSLPDCEKDHLRVYDDRAGTVHGPYCYFTPPPRLTMSSSEARVVFHAGPAHSPSRVGFKANYRSA